MPEALQRVKRELGADAVILGTRHLPAGRLGGLAGRARVEITAAAPETPHPPPAQRRRAVPPLAGDVQQYYLRLVHSEVAAELAARLVQEAVSAAGGDARSPCVRDFLRAAIARMVPTSGGIRLAPGRTRRVALVGPPGSGKTTTLAKLAAEFKLRLRKEVALLSLDMHRLAADGQLRRYAELIGVAMHTAQSVAAVRGLMAPPQPPDLLLVDTPGIALRDAGRFARLAALLRALRPDEVHLVLPASLARPVQQRVWQLFQPLGVSRVVLTRLDEAIGLGVVLEALEKMGWALSYFTAGQNVPRDIEKACGRRVAELIFPPSE